MISSVKKPQEMENLIKITRPLSFLLYKNLTFCDDTTVTTTYTVELQKTLSRGHPKWTVKG